MERSLSLLFKSERFFERILLFWVNIANFRVHPLVGYRSGTREAEAGFRSTASRLFSTRVSTSTSTRTQAAPFHARFRFHPRLWPPLHTPRLSIPDIPLSRCETTDPCSWNQPLFERASRRNSVYWFAERWSACKIMRNPWIRNRIIERTRVRIVTRLLLRGQNF